jgi:hypothetical protein
MGMAQIAAPVAPADEVDGSGGLIQLCLERGHEGILGGHCHAAADAADMEPNGEFIAGHRGVLLAVSFRWSFGQTDNGCHGGMLPPVDAAAMG